MGSENYHTVIKYQHVRHREIVVLVATVLFAAVLVAGYLLGQRSAYTSMGLEPPVYSDPESSQSGGGLELKALQDELDVQQVQNELDRTALEMVRKELASQQNEIGDLREGLSFYKGLMAPEENAHGLSLRKLELIATGASDRFIFRLVAQQEARKHTTLKGSLSMEVFGTKAGEAVSYPLADLSADIEDNNVALRFRYFQTIEGELVVPAGFNPQGFRVIARASSPRKVELREQFPWEVQRRFSYVGK